MEGQKNTTRQFKFKYGQKIYSKVSLRSGIVTDIKMPSSGPLGNNLLITINRGSNLGEETHDERNFTADADVILELLREQMEEYKESFFRVNNTLRNSRP